MSKLTIVANIKAKEENVEFVKTELLKLIDVTRAEEGCLQYDLHQDNENKASFMFYESWASRELCLAHMDSKFLKDCMVAIDGAVESLFINKMTNIS